jgi:hypothetical protein
MGGTTEATLKLLPLEGTESGSHIPMAVSETVSYLNRKFVM